MKIDFPPYENPFSPRWQCGLTRTDAWYGRTSPTVLSRESTNSSVEIVDYPAKDEVILRNFDFFLPKFHFILPNFYIPAPWGMFVCSVALSDFLGTVAKVNSLTILLARLSRLCRKDEAQGAEGEVRREHTSVCDRSRIPKATPRCAFMQQSLFGIKRT